MNLDERPGVGSIGWRASSRVFLSHFGVEEVEFDYAVDFRGWITFC